MKVIGSRSRSQEQMSVIMPAVLSGRWSGRLQTKCVLAADETYQFQSINQHELAMAPHFQSSGVPEIQ